MRALARGGWSLFAVLASIAIAAPGLGAGDERRVGERGARDPVGHSSAPIARPEAVKVLDDRNRSIELEGPALRIISLAPHASDLVVALGAADRLVAVDPHSDAPQIGSTVARVAAYPSLDPERLLALKPDLVLVWGEGMPAPTLARLESLGLRVFVTAPRTLDQVASSLERLARLIDAPRDAKAIAARVRDRLAAIRARYATGPELPVFVQLWEMPLITIGAGSMLDDALRHCGARNVFAAVQAGSQRVSPEAVLAAAPALVISTAVGSTDAAWRRLGLVGEGSGKARFVRVIDPVLERPSPPVLDALERLCEVINRERSTQMAWRSSRVPPDSKSR